MSHRLPLLLNRLSDMVSDPGRRASGLLSTSFNIWRRHAIGDPVLCFYSPMFQVFRTSESDDAVVFSRSDHRAFSEACEDLTADEVLSGMH